MHLISYVISETGAHFLPPTSWVNDEFTWLCELNGRHYARVASLDYGEQDAHIDLTIHDLATETDLAGRLDALAVDRAEARRLRAERYVREMPIGDQLDAILKALDQLRLSGVLLPTVTIDVIDKWSVIKRDHPMPDLLPAVSE